MKKIFLFVLLIAVTVGVAFAETYKEGSAYKYWTNNDKDGYRFLRVATVASGMENLGFIDLIKTSAAGDPRVVEIVSAFSKGDTNFQEKSRQWKAGEKATIEEVMKDPNNIGIVILPGSSVLVASHCIMKIESGAIGWDDDFTVASDFNSYMTELAGKVNYNWVKSTVDSIKPKFVNAKGECPILGKACTCKGDINEHIIISATFGAGVWGALWGLAPPWLFPLEIAKVHAQYTAQAYLAAAIGYLYGKYPKGGAEFAQQLKVHNYVLYIDQNSAERLKHGSGCRHGLGCL